MNGIIGGRYKDPENPHVLARETYLKSVFGSKGMLRRTTPLLRLLAMKPLVGEVVYRNDEEFTVITVGCAMEHAGQLLEAINKEVETSKKTLETLANDVKAVAHIVNPALLKQATDIRDARMTVVREVRESLSALREIRSFFSEADYDKEMERLERLVAVCREFKAMKDLGVLDAVCEAALRLAVAK